MSISQPRDLADEEIRGAVVEAIARSGRVKVADVIHVDVQAGDVLLSGTVDSADEKAAAEAVARGVRGVARVVDRLTIATEGRR
jgi:osmotically-inducible protein OsmY